MSGRKVVEVGSGLGFDGVHFMRCGACWTFTKIELFRDVAAGADFVWAVDLEVNVNRGAAGFVLTSEDRDTFVGREIMLDARPEAQRPTITTDGPQPPRFLLVRNGAHQATSDGSINSACLRSSARAGTGHEG